ncbi:hypothetical protein M407DRAFT_11895 [Tulasnella calospora MUT 4182]|uniref:Uncharacterized protein n=1 Tax=Tulasnella calospora MUT 4182 TaxID=1051891 RepID=A0A0C3KAJ4_9AGAM|nr:hypothetical protein M407DRAFT_11895 [Tulasnella calospora MUT 4182]
MKEKDSGNLCWGEELTKVEWASIMGRSQECNRVLEYYDLQVCKCRWMLAEFGPSVAQSSPTTAKKVEARQNWRYWLVELRLEDAGEVFEGGSEGRKGSGRRSLEGEGQTSPWDRSSSGEAPFMRGSRTSIAPKIAPRPILLYSTIQPMSRKLATKCSIGETEVDN